MDRALFMELNGLSGQFGPADYLMRGLASDYLVPVSLSLLLLGLWFSGSPRVVLGAALSLGLASLLVTLFNFFYFRSRPFSELPTNLLFYRPHDSSFPSNVAAVGFAVAMGVFMFNRRASGLFFLLASLFAISRVYVGVHYPSDILGGAAIGLLSGYAACYLLRLLEPFPSRLLGFARRWFLA